MSGDNNIRENHCISGSLIYSLLLVPCFGRTVIQKLDRNLQYAEVCL